MTNLVAVKVGCDPEFGLFDKKLNRLVSAYGLVPGTKAKPHPVPRGAIQVDGMMVEFNIEPAINGSQFSSNIEHVLLEIKKFLPVDRYDYLYQPTIFYDPGYMSELPTEATELGCSPDYNAWHDGGVNPRPAPPEDQPGMRSCGGHIHISWTENADITDISHRWDCCAVIRVLDQLLLPYLNRIDTCTFRQQLYGKPGAFRPKPYGVEWRTPSNIWLKNKALQQSMINLIISIVQEMFKAGSMVVTVPDKYNPDMPTGRGNRHPFNFGSSYPYTNTLYQNWFGFTNTIENIMNSMSRNTVPTGVRVAATSSKVGFDLNLDIPYKKELNYTTINGIKKENLNPVIK